MGLNLSTSDAELRRKFFALQTPRDVADLLEVDYSRLIYYLHKVPKPKRYLTFPVRKKIRGVRQISSPNTALKIIQKKLNKVLQCVYEPKPSVQGFTLRKNIVTNAVLHSNKRNVLNLDLRGFFPSIHFGRVRGLFMAYPYSINPPAATILAQICCFDNQLPQGAPTSPIVSNMICAKLDSQLQQLAKTHRCTYSRYADDITFSTSLQSFRTALVRTNELGQIEIGKELNRIIRANDFEINTDKVRVQIDYRHQDATGLTVNEFPNVRRKFVRQIRAMLHAWQKFGLENAQKEFLEKYDKKHRGPWKKDPSFKKVVKGKIQFLGMVRGKDDHIYIKFLRELRKLAPELVDYPLTPLEQLLYSYKDFAEMSDHHRRGFLLQDLINELFELFGIQVVESFTRNEGAEQIDGAFALNGSHFIVECRWRKKLADVRELDGLLGQVIRSGKQTMGVFLSINGWSKNVPELLKQNPEKSIILINGDDLYKVLSEEINLEDLLKAKLRHLNFKGEPYLSAVEIISKTDI
jgi:RNA-directed DNA polymerase